jgi:hypothetical protein
MATASERVEALRAQHIVRVILIEGIERCDIDGVRVYPIKTGFRHDTSEVVALNKAAINEPLGMTEVLRQRPHR